MAKKRKTKTPRRAKRAVLMIAAVVWPYTFGDETAVRCFMPGSGT